MLDACRKTAVPRLLAMLCVLAVFVPSFFMDGRGAAAVRAAVAGGRLRDDRVVPAVEHARAGALDLADAQPSTTSAAGRSTSCGRLYALYSAWCCASAGRWSGAYLAWRRLLSFVLLPARWRPRSFPPSRRGSSRLRLRAPTGTRIERTEMIALKALDVIKQEVGPDNVRDHHGLHRRAAGQLSDQHDLSVDQRAARGRAAGGAEARRSERGEALQEELRAKLHEALPDAAFSFEAGDIISQVMSFGSPTPIEVAVQGPNLGGEPRVRREGASASWRRFRRCATCSMRSRSTIPRLNVTIDRDRAGQFGVTMADVAKSLVAATSSSRFTDPNYWRDPRSGNAFQIQVEIPQNKIASREDVGNVAGDES